MALPERLGKYTVTEVLGEGAMGIVYKGFDPDIGREVALKTLRVAADSEAGDGVSQGDRFRNEARAAGRLQHPGIVAVYDFGRETGVPGGVDFIAMEYVRGHTLSRYLSQAVSGQLTIGDDDVLAIVGQLLDALAHAHDAGVWHRDVKPSNLIMTRGGKIKVTDFGIARIESAGLTRAGSLIGTPMYMAPEQFQGLTIDHRVDIYAAGVVLYQLLTGHPPFTGAPESLMYRAVHEPHVPPSQLPGLAHLQTYDEILARALAKKPQARFADAQTFREALAAVVGRRLNDAVSDATVTALLPPAGVPRDRGIGAGSRAGTGTGTSTNFDPAVLAQAEASLARHVGPLAQLLVKRAARDCPDLPALYARLADQVSDPRARQAFISQATVLATGSRPMPAPQGSPSGAAPPPTGTGLRGAPGPRSSGIGAPPAWSSLQSPTDLDAPASPALQAEAQRLLARQLGPIAQVVVRRAAAAAPRRAAFIAQVAEALPDAAARQALIDALHRVTP